MGCELLRLLFLRGKLEHSKIERISMICLYLWVVAQIVLESFPISSSGHTALLARLCPLPVLSHHVLTAFDYALHLPTACVVALFFRRAWSFPFMHLKQCWQLVLKISAFAALATVITLAGYSLRMIMPIDIQVPLSFGFLLPHAVCLA